MLRAENFDANKNKGENIIEKRCGYEETWYTYVPNSIYNVRLLRFSSCVIMY